MIKYGAVQLLANKSPKMASEFEQNVSSVLWSSLKYERGRERAREREREGGRETETDRVRERDIERVRQRERVKEREIERETLALAAAVP